ncbi:MAG: terminase small subunit [Pseudomonadota bacterium]
MSDIKLTDEQQALGDALTRLERMTVIGIIAGKSQRQAYRDAGGKAKTDDSADAVVSKMLSKDRVKAFLNAMYATPTREAVMTREEALERLTSIANDEGDNRNAMQAIKHLSDMMGWNAPSKHELTGKDGQPMRMQSDVSAPEIASALEGIMSRL